MEEVTRQDTIEVAGRIREHQGNHEAEVSLGEADLQKHYRRCEKNPGHTQFIPAQDFKIEHLPTGCQDKDILNWIKAEADLTCRLSVSYTSERRPRFYPGRRRSSFYPFYKYRGVRHRGLRTGTGWVYRVTKYTEKNCECMECSKPGTCTPKKVWGKIYMYTASHVVFDSEEAKRTMCHFFYDASTTPLDQCPSLTGFQAVNNDAESDTCEMACVTHDMDLVDKLDEMTSLCVRLLKKLRIQHGADPNMSERSPGVSYSAISTSGPVVIVSHPHGCSKHVSVGKWTQRQTWSDTFKFEDDAGLMADVVRTSYRYNTPTCRGSSGAPVFRLPEKGKWWWWACHYHSEGSQGNDNSSCVWTEAVSRVIKNSG